MRPGARVRAAIEILEELLATRSGPTPDARLAAWGRENRFAGSKDRAAIGDLMFDALRRLRSTQAAIGAETARAAVLGALAADGATPETLSAAFHDDPHAPAPLTAAETTAIARIARVGLDAALAEAVSAAVRADFPEDLWDELVRSSPRPWAEAERLKRRAPLDLRVNTLKATVTAVGRRLEAAGLAVAAAPLSPVGLRLAPGARLKPTGVVEEGAAEPQDAASQAAAFLSGAAAGDRILDFCAGGGGKTLALAAITENRAEIVAHDVMRERMADIPHRTARAGAKAALSSPERLASMIDGCDLVFVDAPCSGSGAWARSPDGKRRIDAERLDHFVQAQRAALDNARKFVRPGGRLVYVTCSLFRCENEEQSAWFLRRRPEFGPMVFGDAAAALGLDPDVAEIRLSPVAHDCDGFFVAAFRRGA